MIKLYYFLFLIIFFFTTSCFGQVIPNYIPTNGLVGWWPFNGNANDESGNLNHGTVNGATLTSDRNGVANKAYSFDGSNWIEIMNSNSIQPTNAFSISAWIFIESSQPSLGYTRIISKNHSEDQNFATYQLITGYSEYGKPGVCIRTGSGISGNPGIYNWTGATSNNIIGQYQLIVGTYNGSELKIYQNGSLNSSVSHTGNLFYDSGNLWFGRGKTGYVPGTDMFFNGKIDDVGIWNRVLNDQEITSLYNGDCTLKIDSTRALLNCLNDSIKLTTNSILNGQYQWYKNGQQILNAIDTSYLVKEIGTYKIKVTSGLCNLTDSIVIAPISVTKVNAGPDLTVYSGDSLTLTATGASTYSWNNGVLNGVSFIPTSTLTYTVEGVDSNGCKSNDSTIVFVNVSPKINISPNENICQGKSITLNVNYINAPNMMDVEGNNYPVLNIGNQTWTQQNLSVSKYRNGDIIPQVTDPAQWVGLTTGAWCWYDNDSVNYSAYGKLYNWYAIKDPRGIAPNGWHIPSGLEWDNLALFVANGNENAGGHLKEAGTKHWAQPNTDATNSSGFNGLPGGYRANQDASGTFREIGNDGWFFYDADSLAGFKNIYYNNSAINAVNQFGTYNYFSKVTGASVRLIKDTFLITANLPKYVWSTGETTASINVTPTSTTTYYCSITIENQVVKDSVKITVNSIPQINAGPDLTVYSGDSLTLTATGASTYSWNNGVLNGVSFIPTNTLTYTVEGVDDTNGCKGIDSVLISVVPKPKLPAYLPTNGLVGWWPFNGNANDESGNGKNGTVNGATLTADRMGTSSSCYSFIDNDIIVNVKNNQFLNDFSISGWVYLDENSKTHNYPTFISEENNYITLQYEIWPSGTDPKFNMYFLNHYNIGGQQVEDGHVQSQSNFNNWHFFVLNNKNKINSLFIDGELKANSNSPSSIQGLGNGGFLRFGKAQEITDNVKFIGKLDDIAIYSRPLSQIEIDNLYKGDCTLKIDSTRALLNCLNDSIKLTTNSILNGQYQWYKNGQQILNAIDTSYLVKEIGTYKIKVTSGLCNLTDSIVIAPISGTKVNAGPDLTVYSGDSLTLTATGASTYSWNNGVLNGVSFIPTKTLTYTVEGVDDTNGCKGIDSVLISVVPKPKLPSYLPTNGLVGWWPFNGNANDESGKGNDGTVNGAVLTTDRNGIANTAYNFEGLDNYIDILNLNSDKINKEFTISTWINFKSFNSLYPQIINGDNNYVAIHLGGTGYLNDSNMYKKLIFYYNPGPNYTISENELNTNNYYFVTTVKNKDSIYLYINGIKQNTTNFNNANIASGNYIRIGSYAPSINTDFNRGDFDGQIDDISIYNRALNEQEITKLYNGDCTLKIKIDSTRALLNCLNDSIKLTTNSILNGQYQWYKNGQQILNAIDTSYLVKEIGTYKIKVTSGLCNLTDSIVIAPISVTKVNAGPDLTVYSGDSLTLNATGASTYSWNNGVLNGVSFIPTSTLTYTVEGVDDTNGCKGIDTVLISVVPKPKLPSYLPTNGLVGWWPFNGDANDESGNGNNGTVYGADLTIDRYGVYNKAYNFSNDSVAIKNTSNFDLTNVTVTGWINTTLIKNDYQTLFSHFKYNKISQQNLFSGYWLGVKGGKATFFLADNKSIGIDINSKSNVNDGKWHQITGLYSNGIGKIFVDGHLEDSLAYSMVLSPSTLTKIGGDVIPGGEFFEGKIDDIGVWNRPLSPSEIYQLYNGDCTLKIKIDSTRALLNCLNDSIKLTTNSVLNGQYQWYKNGQQIINAIDTSYLVKEIGTYKIKVTSGLCNLTDSIVIKPISPIKVNAGPDLTVCAGKSVTLKASGAINYLWNNSITDGIAFVPKNSSIYTVVGKDLNGCEGIDTVNISIVGNNVNLKIYSGSDGISCNGIAMVSTNYSSDFSIRWSNGQVSSTSNDTCFTLCSGPMTVVINDELNNCNYSFSGIITNKTNPQPLSSSINISNSSKNISCKGSSTILAFGGQSPYIYSLINNKGLVLNNLNKVDSLCPGIYKYKITDSKNDSIFNTFLISDSSSTISNVNPIYKDSIIIDTLIVNAIENCSIDFQTIDSIWINNYSFKGLDSLSVIWNIKDTNGIYPIEVLYNVPNCQGVFNLELSLYCPTKSSDLPFKKTYNQLFISTKQASINNIKTENFKIFPNPFNEFLHVNFNGYELTNYTLVDAIGKIVLSGNIKPGENTISTELIPKGVYFLKIGENSSSTIVKI